MTWAGIEFLVTNLSQGICCQGDGAVARRRSLNLRTNSQGVNKHELRRMEMSPSDDSTTTNTLY